jgi:hypothetical protein
VTGGEGENSNQKIPSIFNSIDNSVCALFNCSACSLGAVENDGFKVAWELFGPAGRWEVEVALSVFKRL